MAKKSIAKEAAKEIVRVTFRFHGPELEQIREVRDMLSLNSEVDAARYLIQRGLEVLTASLTSRRVQTKMLENMNAESIVKAMIGMGVDPTKQIE
jgi:hypothetical protein